MHALGRYIVELMDARRWTRSDVVRASGLTRQHLAQILDKSKDSLGRMPEPGTIAALARAFPEAGEGAFIWKAAESMGVPVDRLSIVTPDLDAISNEALLGILAQRLGIGAPAWSGDQSPEDENGPQGPDRAAPEPEPGAGGEAPPSPSTVAPMHGRRRKPIPQLQERAARDEKEGRDQ